jgi:hypothetical protein
MGYDYDELLGDKFILKQIDIVGDKLKHEENAF